MAKVERARVGIVGDETREVKWKSVGCYHWTDLLWILAFIVSEIRGYWKILSRRVT